MISAQPVSPDAVHASGPSRAADCTVRALLDADTDFSQDDMRDMLARTGIGDVQVKVADTVDIPLSYGQSARYFITLWNVYVNGKLIGSISRDYERPTAFVVHYKGPGSREITLTFGQIRFALRYLLQREVGYAASSKLAATATIEEDAESQPSASKIELLKGPDGRDMLSIPHMGMISNDQWERISGIMRGKGYDSRGAADASRAVQSMLSRRKAGGGAANMLLHDDWVETIARVIGLKGNEAKVRQDPNRARKVFARAVRAWGLTSNPGLAGYILPSGNMLDMSGRSGIRARDHREVSPFLGASEHGRGATEAMYEFMDLGAVRWMPEGPSLHLRVPPTKAQCATIVRIKSGLNAKLYLDLYSPNYGDVAQEYGADMPGQRIVNDIQSFYKTGKLGHMSQLQKFHGEFESQVKSHAEAVVATLIEDETDSSADSETEDDVDVDLKSVLFQAGLVDEYHQIDGDFGDPWLYGGTWCNLSKARGKTHWDTMVHIDGIESDYGTDYDASSSNVKKLFELDASWRSEYEKKYKELLDKELIDQGSRGEPATDPETVEWCKREASREAEDEILDKIADDLNAKRKLAVYRTNAHYDPYEDLPDPPTQDLESAGISTEQFEKMTTVDRILIYAFTHGWHALDSNTVMMDKAELSAKLGIKLK